MFLQGYHLDFADRIIKKYRKDADNKLAAACRIMIFLVLTVALLNFMGIFKIAPVPLYVTTAISVFNFLLPTILYRVFKREGKIIRYVIITILIIQSGVFYSALSYHVIIMLVFPLIISCLYNEKKYVIYTMIVSVPVMIISHLIAYRLHIVPDEPLVTLRGVWLYGILPRVIEFWGVGIVCYFISDRIQRLITTLADKNSELYSDQESLILSLSDMIASKSRETGQHVQRVAQYTAVLCKGLGYTEEKIWIISLASMMHDVGKIIIPADIIEKPGKLTDEEFLLVKKHVGYGKQMLQNSPGEVMSIAADIAYQHHEKWNGRGYLGFRGEEISIYARCVAVADVFDALVSRRPYKEPWSYNKAYDEIVRLSGEQFDPKVVKTFQDHFDDFKLIMERYPDEIPKILEPDLEVEASIFRNLVKQTDEQVPLLLRACLGGEYGVKHEYRDGAMIEAGFVYLSGEPDEALFHSLKGYLHDRTFICLTQKWENVMKAQTTPLFCVKRYLMKINMTCLDVEELRKIMQQVPMEYELTEFDARAFSRKPFGHGNNYQNYEEFEKYGCGAVIWHRGVIVASASSFLSYQDEVEVDLYTLPEYRKQGLASACAAKMLLGCKEREISLHWDAQSQESRRMAEKLGFHLEYQYQAYCFELPELYELSIQDI